MATNAFLKLSDPDILGESTDALHPRDISILSWSHSFNQPTPPDMVAEAELAKHGDFTFSKYLDAATPDLLRHCWNGTPIGKAVFSCYRADGDNRALLYLRIEMESVIVSNVSIGGGAVDLPTETITFAYRRVAYAYSPLDGGQEAVVHHDVGAGVVG